MNKHIPSELKQSKGALIIGGILVFFFIIGALADVFGAWDAIRSRVGSNDNSVAEIEPTENSGVDVTEVEAVLEAGSTPVPTLLPDDAEDEQETNSSTIAFADPNNENELNPLFRWYQGDKLANGYDLTMNPGKLTMFAAGRTDQWQKISNAPIIAIPISGNFTTQVKVEFDPKVNYQAAGIGIRSSTNTFTWIRVGHVYFDQRYIGRASMDNGVRTEPAPNSLILNGTTVYYRLQRHNSSIFSGSYSYDGVQWITLMSNLVTSMPVDTEVYLYVYSAQNDFGVMAQFEDFVLIQNQ